MLSVILERCLQDTCKYIKRVTLWEWIIFSLLLSGMIIYQIWQVRKYNKEKAKAYIDIATLLYFLSVIIVTFCSRMPDNHFSYKLNPFISYHSAFIDNQWKDIFHIIVNILLFVPFGIIAPIWYKQRKNDKLSFLDTIKWAAFFTLSIEIIQFITKMGSFETDDLINNTLGTVIGYLMYMIIRGLHLV